MPARSLTVDCAMLCLAVVAAALFHTTASASIQDEDICWSPDVEFPTSCDEDED